ncbi:pilus biosynthesis protein PilO [Oceanisphaera marina]|uniref:Pilus biosynthesis protein PilO n=1 Tax=Oceanisphaera marina TaxID=2017550 RepID=A0ABQ1IRR1_9GAMM|nr:type 4a pilus biogenesis protein PilO [Oceanisphaera marina]GGB50929.1 pilus biosynthesis protein PilO [Oceanisphaera marina]
MSWSFHELEFEQVEQWPAAAKSILFVLVSGILCLAGGYVFLVDDWSRWQQSQQQEGELKRTLMQKARMAANLPAYHYQTEQLHQQLQTLLTHLPSKRETARILNDISALAERNQLKLAGFQWQTEQPLAFATELPMRIQAQGTYHQLGHFIAQLSALPDIVIIDSVELALPDTLATSQGLNMELLAKTYVYQTEEVFTEP